VRKLSWPGGKVVLSFTLAGSHVRVLQRIARERAKKAGLRYPSTSGAMRDLIEKEADFRGWALR
jgi:hypothetical protein